MWLGRASIYLMTGFRCCKGVRRSTDLHAATMPSSLLSCFCKLWHALGTIAEGAVSPSNSGHCSLSISFLMSADSTGTGVVSSSCTCWSITRPVEGDCWDGSFSEIHLMIFTKLNNMYRGSNNSLVHDPSGHPWIPNPNQGHRFQDHCPPPPNPDIRAGCGAWFSLVYRRFMKFPSINIANRFLFLFVANYLKAK